MIRLALTAAVVSGSIILARPHSGTAQDLRPNAGAERAADVVDAILSGRDDPAVWGALEAALGEGVPALPIQGLAGDGEEASHVPGGMDAERSEVTVFGATLRLPAWVQSGEARRIAAGVGAALLVFLAIAVVWTSGRLMLRALRSGFGGDRRGRTLVRRKKRDLPPSRDAERLHAQLRARRAA